MKTEQSFANGLGHQAAHLAFLVELHFALGGVDVDVHGGGIDFEEEAADRETALHQGGVVAFEQGEIQAAIFHGAAVHEEMLIFTRGTRNTRRTDETPDAEEGRGWRIEDGGWFVQRGGGRIGIFDDIGFAHFHRVVNGEEFLFAAVDGTHAFAEGSKARRGVRAGIHGGELPDDAAILGQRERDFGIRQRGEREVMMDVRELGFFAAEEFAAGGEVEEKLADLDARAGRTAGGFDLENFAAGDDDLRGFGRSVIALARGENEAAHAGDAWQRFAAKAHRGNRAEVFGALNFAGGVAFEAEQGVIAAHAEAVVRDADQASAASLDFHGDARGAGVEGILDEFLNHAGGAFDHFASGDLVGDLFRQEANAVHRGAGAKRGKLDEGESALTPALSPKERKIPAGARWSSFNRVAYPVTEIQEQC